MKKKSNINVFITIAGIMILFSVITQMLTAFAVYSECKEAEKKLCLTKAIREVQGRGFNLSTEE